MRYGAKLFLGSALALVLAGCQPSAPSGHGEALALVPIDASWRYSLASAARPGWMEVDYDDAAWAEGPGPLGFGEEEVRTVVPPPAGGEEGLGIAFRTRFEVAEDTPVAGMMLRFGRDDGLVVFLNGREILRNNLQAGELTLSTEAPRAVPDEEVIHEIMVDRSLIRRGENVLAAAVYQASARSDDLLLSLELPALPPTTAASVVRGPYLQLGTSDSVVVRFRTSQPALARVVVGDAPDDLERTFTSPNPIQEHAIRVSGLRPDRVYYYGIDTLDGWLREPGEDLRFRTPPATGSSAPVRIWVTGDPGTSFDWPSQVVEGFQRFDAERRTSAWITLGDNGYPSGTDGDLELGLFDIFAPVLSTIPLWPTIGNHDLKASSSAKETGPYFDAFDLPRDDLAGGLASGSEAYYAFDHGNVHLVSIDTAGSRHGEMMRWLAADLAATEQEWIIVYAHHPPYSRGTHDSDEERSTSFVRKRLLPILEEADVDLVITGHSHGYERSYLLHGAYTPVAEFPDAAILQRSRHGPYRKAGGREGRGAIYVVAGHAGHAGDGPYDHPAMAVSHAEAGSVVIDVAGCRLESSEIDLEGKVRDAFSIEKGAPCSAEEPAGE